MQLKSGRRVRWGWGWGRRNRHGFVRRDIRCSGLQKPALLRTFEACFEDSRLRRTWIRFFLGLVIVGRRERLPNLVYELPINRSVSKREENPRRKHPTHSTTSKYPLYTLLRRPWGDPGSSGRTLGNWNRRPQTTTRSCRSERSGAMSNKSV